MSKLSVLIFGGRPPLIIFQHGQSQIFDQVVTLTPSQVIGQSLASWVGADFKLIAYAFILLHGAGLPFVDHL